MSERLNPPLNKSYVEPEDYFNEITREFILDEVIHEDMTNAPTVVTTLEPVAAPALIPDIAFADIPKEIQELIHEPLPAEPGPEIIHETRPFSNPENEFQITNLWLEHRQKILITIAAAFVFIFTLSFALQKKSGVFIQQQDQRMLQTERPTFDISPKYHDWPEVENDYIDTAQ